MDNWVLERLVEQGAARLGLAPEEIRRRNFILPGEFPYKIPTGNVYDSGNQPEVLDKALSMIDLEHWRTEKARLRESATITIDPTGAFQLLLHSQAMWCNSPETVATIVLAEEFGIELESVNVS